MTVVSFPETRRGFAAACKAWLDVWTDSRVTHGEARLAMRLFLYIDWKHFQATGQLLSYPSWKRLQEETTLTKRSVARSLKKFESVGAIKIIRSGCDPKTGQRRPNQYLLIPPNQNRNETAQVAWMAPSQVTPESPGQVTQPGDSSDIRPGDSRAPISGEVRVSGEYINIESPGDSNVTSQVTDEGRGCPRVEGPRVLPSPDSLPSPSTGHPAGNGGGNGGPPAGNGAGVYVGFSSPLMARLEAYERRTGKTLPRDKRGGWLLTPAQLAAVEGGS